MKSSFIVLLAGFALVALADKPEFDTYGFIKGDMMISTSGVSSWGQPSPTAPFRATASDTQAIAFSAQQSRFGFKGSAPVGQMHFGGQLEMDFFLAASNTITNANPRLRLAYAWLRPTDDFGVRIGQQWDVFSPLNPTMNNLASNLWMNGNYGYRRAQFLLRYRKQLESLTPEISISAGEGAKESVGIGADNVSLMPLLQGRAGVAVEKLGSIGVSGVYGAFGQDKDYTVWGINVDLNAPVHELFALKGEFALGNNLHNANLFSIAGAQSNIDETDKKTIGFWVNAISKPLETLHISAGFAMEMNQTEGISGSTIETNSTAFGDVIVPLGDYFSFVAGYQHFITTLASGTEYTAGLVSLTGKVVF